PSSTLVPYTTLFRSIAEQKLAAQDVRLKTTDEAARKAPEAKPRSDAEDKAQAEKAEAALALSEADRKGVQTALNSLGYEFPTVTDRKSTRLNSSHVS